MVSDQCSNDIPVLGFAGFSESGKTTLIEALIKVFAGKGISVAVIKHDAHGLVFDHEGKDSHRFSKAGAIYSIVNGPDSSAVFVKHGLSLKESISMVNGVDLIIVEGYKNYDSFEQIGISRKITGKGLPADISKYVAVVTDEDIDDKTVPIFGLNEYESIADFIIERKSI